MPLHHLVIGTWTPPGAIFTVQFDDEALELKLVKRTEIPHDEPISWMAFDVGAAGTPHGGLGGEAAADTQSTAKRTSMAQP